MVHFLLQEAAEVTEPLTDNIMGHAWFITAVGMGILFVSLLVLWGVMEILVRIAKDAPKDAEEEAAAPVAAQVSDEELKTRAAAAAVASIQDYDLKIKAAAAAAGYAVAGK